MGELIKLNDILEVVRDYTATPMAPEFYEEAWIFSVAIDCPFPCCGGMMLLNKKNNSYFCERCQRSGISPIRLLNDLRNRRNVFKGLKNEQF